MFRHEEASPSYLYLYLTLSFVFSPPTLSLNSLLSPAVLQFSQSILRYHSVASSHSPCPAALASPCPFGFALYFSRPGAIQGSLSLTQNKPVSPFTGVPQLSFRSRWMRQHIFPAQAIPLLHIIAPMVVSRCETTKPKPFPPPF